MKLLKVILIHINEILGERETWIMSASRQRF